MMSNQASYAYGLKPMVTSMEELELVDKASALFEDASGCRLHRNVQSTKCKRLPLGGWRLGRKRLKIEDFPESCNGFFYCG